MFVQLTNYAYLYIKICCLLQIAVSPIAVINTIFIKRKWKLNTIYRLETNVYFPTNKKTMLSQELHAQNVFFKHDKNDQLGSKRWGNTFDLRVGMQLSIPSGSISVEAQPLSQQVNRTLHLHGCLLSRSPQRWILGGTEERAQNT